MKTQKVKRLEIKLCTAREQAEYYFNQEFSAIPLELIKDRETGLFEEIMMPSMQVVAREFLDDRANEDDLRTQFKEKQLFEGESYPEEQFLYWVSEQPEFDDYYWGEWQDNNYPIHGWVFACPDFYVNSDYMDVDRLYKMGIGVINHETGFYLFISGEGYDFYEAHWIPLFKALGWIKEAKKNGNN